MRRPFAAAHLPAARAQTFFLLANPCARFHKFEQ